MALWMYEIEGARPLNGRVRISGSKNASLPLLAAALLADTPTTLFNVPVLRDTMQMKRLIEHLGAKVTFSQGVMTIDPSGFKVDNVPYDIMCEMRASFYAMGPMLARLGKARVSQPGGCAIGDRPVDIHLRGFKSLGVRMTRSSGYIHARHKGLVGTRLSLMGPKGTSVGATINVLMAAVLASGTTIIDDAAREPEVIEMISFLNAMGARIEGSGTNTLTIEGVTSLRGIEYKVSPDRIEAGTWAVAALVTHGDVVLENIDPVACESTLELLERWGADLSDAGPNAIRVRRGKGTKNPLSIVTEPFPGFPTDVQSAFTTLLALTPGESDLRETIYPERFKHVPELNRMGARIKLEGSRITIKGVAALEGAAVMASDLRAGAALVIAALAAHGTSQVRRIYHVERGYEDLVNKLVGIGAVIRRVEEADVDPGLMVGSSDMYDAQVEELIAPHREVGT